jgi:uncharacterized protein YgbK (DUF1537 family)
MTFVIGSTDPITRAQVAALRAAVPDLVSVAVTADGPRDLPVSSSPITLIEADTRHLADPAAVSTALARTLSAMGGRARGPLFLCGGATAQAVLGHLGIASLELIGEALPGLPIARSGRVQIVTKSGGFGDRDVLVSLLHSGISGRSDQYVE